MLLTDALSRCPSQASGEIKLDMRVDYIAFSKAWIAKLKETTREDPILGTGLPAHSAGVATPKEAYSQNGQGVLGLQRPALYRQGTAPDGSQNCHSILPSWEEYLQRLHQGHLSATKVQQNARQHLYWPGLDADIADYTRRCQECIC